jgi:PAS domain S-box-containing protein
MYHNLRFLFLPFIAVLELWLVVAYVKRTEWIRHDFALGILVVPVITVILALTSPFHTLFRYNFHIDTTTPIPVLAFDESLWFPFYSAYSFAILFLAIVLLMAETRRQGTMWEMPTLLLLAALAFPTVLNSITQYAQIPFPGINLTPALLWIPAMLYGVALFRYRFLDIVPIARSRLIETLNKVVMVLDTEMRIIDMNPAAESLIGTHRVSALGRTIGEVTVDWPAFVTFCSDEPGRKQQLVRLAGDRTFWYLGSVERLLTPTGQPEGYLIFLDDITELKQAQQALLEKTEELDQYFSTSLDLFCIADTQGYFRRLNPQWEKTLGYPLIELEGRRFLDFVHPDDLQGTLDAISDLSSQKEVLNFTNRYRHRDGTYRWIEWRSFPKGERIFAAARDITERKQMEEALRESEEKYRAIIEEMQDPFYRTDLEGRITMLSPSAATIAGYDSIDQLIGRPVSDVYADPAERDRFLAALREKGAVDSYPLPLKTRDGTLRHVTTSSHFFRDASGAIAGVEGVIHDITDQRKAEEALRMANKKLNLLSSVTRHDIRNQLMALMAFLELSMDSLDKPEEVVEFLKKNQKIATTISEQITFTREYEDFGVKAPSWQKVGMVVEKAVAGLPLRSARVTTETGDLEIFADPLVGKVFYNLIDNSLRYGGETMNTIRITARPEGMSLVLIFEDNGVGIPDNDKPVIFDRGFGKNTGLGLYLSREILGITGITITETGEPGKGARFEITIPAGGFRWDGAP